VSNSFSFVIPAAGQGKRMGGKLPKSLYEIHGKTVIKRQIEQIRRMYENPEIIVVAGFHHAHMIDHLRPLRENLSILINEDWETTGTAASVRMAAHVSSNNRLVSIDGDTLIADESLHEVVNSGRDAIGVTKITSETPVFVEVSPEMECISFQRYNANKLCEWEYMGPTSVSKSAALNLGSGHVFQGLSKQLPVLAIPIDGIEFDTQEEFARAKDWVARGSN